jgi:hypothetical protein
MLARNPKTGAPIRILRSEASLSRTQKTLVWLKNQDPSIAWDRWDTVCVGVRDVQRWEEQGKEVDFMLLMDSSQEEVDFFLSLDHVTYKMICIPKALVFAIGWQKFRSLQLSNVIVMEEAHLMYPYLGEEWDKTPDDGVLMMATILRMSRLIGMTENYTSNRLKQLAEKDIPIHLSNEAPMPLWYITQYYKPEKTRRAREIKKCLEENVKCSVIDKVVLLNEKDFSEEFPKTNKIHQDIVGKRLTYKMVVEWVIQNVPDNVICVFGNADIYLDDSSWKDIWSVNLENVFLALLRWDIQEGDAPSKLFGPRNDSQDTWGFLSTSVKSKQWDLKQLDIPFGKAGCDNAITVEMLRKKFLIVNPALSLKTHHLQLSNYRTYDPQEIVDRPCYMYVDPTGFHDMEPMFEIGNYKFDKLDYKMFERRLRSTKAKSLDVYCKMLERGERYYWKANGMNPHPEESLQLYKYKNAFQTPQGLVYGYNQIYIGKDDISKEAWSKSQLSPIHPAYQSDLCFAVPWLEEYETSGEGYMMRFLPKILQLRETYGKGEFFAKEGLIEPYLACFQWEEAQLPVLSHKPNVQIWCKELIQVPYTSRNEIHTEDIAMLRKYCKGGWQQYPTEKKWVVVIDGKYITTEMVRKWETEYSEYEWTVVYDGRTSPERVVEKMRGATGCVYYGGSKSVSRWGFTWVLPKGASVIEVQNEMDPDGEAAHLSGAAGLVHSLVIVPRAADSVLQEMVQKEVSSTLKGLLVIGPLEARKPVVYMPRKSLEGFFKHAGDSFREMVNLWEEKGYVECVEHETAVQIWMDGVGKTLLYDRPTYDWLFASPPEEQKWELALFGNPKPMESGGPAKSWLFWPRNPRLLEEVVTSGIPQKSWSSREKFLVFYGKIENKVQEKRRTIHDWSNVCDGYCLQNIPELLRNPKNASENAKKNIPLPPKAYLEALANAKFGLCLAGYGKKCHREIECMAMGCVPVCAPEVDMESYANPPQEGIHYIRVSGPEEISVKVASISEERWTAMSAACIQWWQQNASAEGSWALTQKLKQIA